MSVHGVTDCYLPVRWLLWRIKAVRNQAQSPHALDIAMVDPLLYDREDEEEDGPPVWMAIWITCGLMLWVLIALAVQAIIR